MVWPAVISAVRGPCCPPARPPARAAPMPCARAQVPDERAFMRLVADAFSERRKMLRNNLQPTYTSKQVGRVGGWPWCAGAG